MARKITESIDNELKMLEARNEFGGAKSDELAATLERTMRDLKVFDQKRHRSEQMEDDVNRKLEGIIVSLEKIAKVLKDNGLLQGRE